MEIKTLGELCNIVSGGTPLRSRPEYWNNGTIPWIKIGDMKGKYINSADECITQAGLDSSSAKMLPKGTILYTIFATLGEVGILEINASTNQAIAGLTIKDNSQILSEYLYYYLKSKKGYVKTIGRGVAQSNINMSILKSFQVPLPTSLKQKEIVDILDKITNIIKYRQQELHMLDNLIKARFAELFGDTFSNPKRWPTKTFREASLRLSDGPFGSNLKSEHYSENGVRVIRLGNIGVGKFIDKDQSYVSLDHYSRLKKYTCKPGEIVIGTLGEPNLRACIIPDYVKLAVNKADCVHYVPDSKILENTFVCQYINFPTTLLLASNMVHGQTRARVSSGQIAKMPIFIPPLSLQQQFADFVAQIDKSKATVQKALDETQLLFDSLMQQYFG